ncbi:MAG: histidinol-phosphate transaminase [Thermoleophilia bacterium]|nr:histidinol-phosphate transaminase [Thermoleophilia bacterium]
MKYRTALDALTAYRPGPPLAAIKERYGLERVAKLASNECPEGPFPEVLAAMREALPELNRYPDGGCVDLKAVVAGRTGLAENQLVFGNGSCELLMLIGRAVLGAGGHMIFARPSFVVYESIARVEEARYDAVPLRAHAHDLEAMLEAVTPETRLVIVCNPNNPTGTFLGASQLREFVRAVPSETVIVLDEAYIEYVNDPGLLDTVPWLSEHENLIILRTFSKIYGLAGMRVGYGMAHPGFIEVLDKVRQPFNVTTLAQVAAGTAMRLPERVAERRAHVVRERARVTGALEDLGIRTVPSQANFVLLDIEGLAVPGKEVPQALLERGVMTRSGYAMGCPGWLRVTIGSTDENDLFLSVLEEVAAGRSRS